MGKGGTTQREFPFSEMSKRVIRTASRSGERRGLEGGPCRNSHLQNKERAKILGCSGFPDSRVGVAGEQR